PHSSGVIDRLTTVIVNSAGRPTHLPFTGRELGRHPFLAFQSRRSEGSGSDCVLGGKNMQLREGCGGSRREIGDARNGDRPSWATAHLRVPCVAPLFEMAAPRRVCETGD